MIFNENTPLKNLLNDKYIGEYLPYIFYGYLDHASKYTIKENSLLCFEGLEWLYNESKKGNVHQYFVEKARPFVNLIHISHDNGSKVAFMVSGGGMYSIDHCHEGLPMGRKLFENGYDVCIITYGINKDAKGINSIRDLANCIKYAIEHKEQLNIDINSYIVVGGSAGGYIVGQYGTTLHGYKSFNLPKPKCLCLLYPVVNFNLAPEGFTAKKVMADTPKTKENLDKWATDLLVDKNYPSTYVIHSTEDPIVKVENSRLLVEQLKKNNINYFYKEYNNAVHGWSTGYGLESYGWMNHFIDWNK